jgi:hypothetical protein
MITYNTADWIGEELVDALYKALEEINERLPYNKKVKFDYGGGYTLLCDNPAEDETVKGIELWFEIVEDEDD